MPDWTRRQALAALGSATVGVGGYWWFDDHCLDRREPTWTLDGRYWSPPVSDDYCTYVSEGYGFTGRDAAHRIASLANFDGSPNWVFTEVGAGAGVPLVADGTVYVGTGRDRVYALDRRSGHVEWRYDAGGRETYGGGAWGKPVAVAEFVAVGVSHSDGANADPRGDSFTHRVVALGADSGEEVWATEVDGMVWTGPVTARDAVIAATKTGSVYGFETDDGTRRWRTEVGTEIRQPLFADARQVHAISEDGRVAALDPESGAKQWTASIPGKVRAAERDDRSLLVGDDAGTVVALARDSGRERWRFEGDAAIADVASDGSHAYVFDQRGIIHVLDAAEGEHRDRFRIAENAGKNTCGWVARHHRGAGLLVSENALTVTGPWVGQFPRYRE